MTYPTSAGFVKGSDTSKQAAEQLQTQGRIATAVLLALRQAGRDGLIVDEARIFAQDMNKEEYERSTVAARFSELKNMGFIEDTGNRRESKKSGRMVAVFKITTTGRDYLLNS